MPEPLTISFIIVGIGYMIFENYKLNKSVIITTDNSNEIPPNYDESQKNEPPNYNYNQNSDENETTSVQTPSTTSSGTSNQIAT